MAPINRFLFVFCLLFGALGAEEELLPNFTLVITMRDGTELPTDIYLPQTNDLSSHPCILMRNPSGRRAQPWQQYAALAKAGYVVAFQDTRNRLDKEGTVMPYFSDGWGEQQDGYDTVEWLAKSPFTNGKIGTIGFSAPGITQLLMAPSAPPSLKCQYIGVAASDLYSQAVFNGGQILKNQVEGWWAFHGNNPDVLAFVINQREYNAFWDQVNTDKVAHQVTVPAIHYGGWFDIFLQGTIEAFASRQYNGGTGAKGKQKLLIGPWTHSWPRNTKIGDFDVPKEGAKPPYDFSPLAWFNYHLKGQGNLMEELPEVTYYVMGPFDGTPSKGNRWKTSSNWPIAATPKSYFLSLQGGLSENSSTEKGVKEFTYDPMNPVPTLGGRNLFLESGAKDQRSVENRSDVIVFTTEPLKEDLEITGSIQAQIYASSDCADTDIVAKLTDVYPDGRSILICDGICRMGYIRTSLKGKSIEQPTELELDLGNTSIVFAAGHRIRLTLSSSNYPRYERNMNVVDAQEECKTAHNRIWIGSETPSQLILPVVD
jgi:hypothetical protein